MAYTIIDYLADQLHKADAMSRNVIEPRWWCLRASERAKYIRMARERYDAWRHDERALETKYKRLARRRGG